MIHRKVFNRFSDASNEIGVMKLLNEIEKRNVRDSTTILSWQIEVFEMATIPSNA